MDPVSLGEPVMLVIILESICDLPMITRRGSFSKETFGHLGIWADVGGKTKRQNGKTVATGKTRTRKEQGTRASTFKNQSVHQLIYIYRALKTNKEKRRRQSTP